MIKNLLLSALLAAGLVNSSSAATPKDTLIVAWRIDDIVSLDPAEAFEFSGTETVANTYNTLVSFDPTDVTRIYPVIAESWLASEDNKTLTFKIKKGLKFASGNPIRSEDVAYSLQRTVLLDKSPAFVLTQFGFNKDNVKDMIKATDGDTVVLTFDKGYAPSFVLSCLSIGLASVVDKQLLNQHEVNGDMGNSWLKNHYAGSGSFVLKTFKPNEAIVLERNPNAINVPKLKTVFIRHIAESSVQRLLLEKGDIDIAKNLQSEQVEALKDNKKLKLESAAKGSLYYISFNQKNPILANPKVIEALKYLVDYKGINDYILKYVGVEHQGFIPKGLLGSYEENNFSLDVEKAKKLLAEAGYPDGFNINMDVRDNPERLDVAKSIQNTFAKAGVKVSIVSGTGKQVLTKYRSREHDSTIQTWGTDYPDPHTNAATFVYNPDNSDNAKEKTLAWRNAWEPKDLTNLANAALNEHDGSKREQMYRDLQLKFLKTAPFIVFSQQQEVVMERNNIDGYKLGPSYDTNWYYPVSKSN